MIEREEEIKPLFVIGFGLLSAFFYCTILLALAFLIPLLVAGAKKGLKALLLSSAVSGLLISGFQILLNYLLGERSPATLAIALLPPLGMIAGLLFVALTFDKPLSFVTRALIGGLISSLCALPSVLYLRASPDLIPFLNQLNSQMSTLLPSSMVDAENFRLIMLQIVECAFGAMFFLFVFINSWIGSRISAGSVGSAGSIVTAGPAGSDGSTGFDGSTGSETSPATISPGRLSLSPLLQDYKVPLWMVWFLLASWAVILLSRYVPSAALNAVAWNVALSFSVCYAVQGLAVLLVRLAHSRLAPAARFMVTLLLVLVAVGGPVGYAVAGLLSLVGTLETWIPLRNIPKGEQP